MNKTFLITTLLASYCGSLPAHAGWFGSNSKTDPKQDGKCINIGMSGAFAGMSIVKNLGDGEYLIAQGYSNGYGTENHNYMVLRTRREFTSAGLIPGPFYVIDTGKTEKLVRGDGFKQEFKVVESSDACAEKVAKSKSFAEALEKKNLAEAEQLLKDGADPNGADFLGNPLMFVMARDGNLPALQLLAKYGANLNAKNTSYNNTTPLGIAVQRRRVEIVRFLISQKVDVNMPNGHGETPLMTSVKGPASGDISSPKPEITKMLLEAGADLSLKDRWDETAMSYAKASGSTKVIELLKASGRSIATSDGK